MSGNFKLFWKPYLACRPTSSDNWLNICRQSTIVARKRVQPKRQSGWRLLMSCMGRSKA